MNSPKLAVASLSVASAVLACTAVASTDDVDVDLAANTLETQACSKAGCPPPPPPSGGSTCVAPDGGPTPVVFPGMPQDLEVNPYPVTTGGATTGSGGLRGQTIVVATSLEANATTSTTTTTTGTNASVVGGITTSSGLVFNPTPTPNPNQYSFECKGTTPEGLSLHLVETPEGSGIYKCFAGCVDNSNGSPHGFTALSVYVCPPAFPVNVCIPWADTCMCIKP